MSNKKKIVLVIDTENWSFHNIAKQIKKNLSGYYDIDIIPGDIFHGNMVKLFIYCQEYDLIHFLWRGYLSLIDNINMDEYLDSIGFDKNEFYQNYVYNKIITTTVCDHLYLNDAEFWRTKEILKYCKNYIVTSKKLFKIYNELEDIKRPFQVINDGVDTGLYQPCNLQRFDNINNVTIGWVGNSEFTDSDMDSDLKGLRGIIIPAIEELKQENYNITLKIADRKDGMIKQEDMPLYYNSIDLYVCASKTEGTPLPILEAMSCGLPIISTNVGVVEECFGKEQCRFILKERSKEALKDKIKSIIDNNEFKLLSQENIKKIQDWSWEKISQKYKQFFDVNL